MHEVSLDGCRSTPLAGYLKALGVLRLLAEQSDRAAQGWWKGNSFFVRTKLDQNELWRFFLEDYCPTPIVAPWNGGSGFFFRESKARDLDPVTGKKLKTGVRDEATTATRTLRSIETSSCARLTGYREAIAVARKLLRQLDLTSAPVENDKNRLIGLARAHLPPASLAWLDATAALLVEPDDAGSSLLRAKYPPLLGSGGNDGNLDFSTNFLQRISEIFELGSGAPTTRAPMLLAAALFDMPSTAFNDATIGQFAPGAAGGPNSGIGFKGPAHVNAWDFALMLEGTLVFAGGVSRRLEGAGAAYLSYPFTVRMASAGAGSASFQEQADARGELWAPLWTRPATYPEVQALFREGRLSVGARPARDGLDAARAVGGLAADRRIAAFERYGFVKRQGLAFLAAPLGCRVVRRNPGGELLTDLDRNGWLETLRRKAASPEASADLRDAVRGLEDCAFALLERPHDHIAVQAMLIAVGRIARVAAHRPKLREGMGLVAPPPRLSGAWIAAGDDGTSAFRLAVALSGLRARLSPVDHDEAGAGASSGVSSGRRFGLPMRAHFGPLDPDASRDQPRWNVEKGGALAVWNAGGLVENLCAVARRRLLEHVRLGLSQAPFDGAVKADSGEIAAFLEHPRLDQRIADLVLGLSWVDPVQWSGERRAAAMPFAYTVLKPLFTPRSVFERLGHETLDLPMPSALPALLATGRIPDAVRLAQERARASGLPTPFLDPRGPRAQNRAANIQSGRRLLAALVIPVRDGVVAACLEQAYPSSDQEPRHAV